ncbi:MFS transporter [Nonomuraea sp. KM88]|uniref:MFS transporter n=1 Tax=Nonomuraea sp. KM88 TaxID=3457427 RepID=UPI003FCC7AAC
MRLGQVGSALARSILAPGRFGKVLGALHLVESVGKGVFLSGSIIYFTAVKDFSPAEVSLGISVAGALGFVASLVLGILADRVGPVRFLCAVFVLQGLGYLAYTLVDSVASFFVLMALVGFVDFGGGPAFAAIVTAIFRPDDRVRARAALRSQFNLGFSVGSGLSALAVLGGPAFIQATPTATGIMLLVSGVITLWLPGIPPSPRGKTRTFGAVRDLRFMRVVALSVPLAVHASIILVALPLWIVTRTGVPHEVVPLLLVLNTAIVVLFQVAASKGADTVSGAARLARRSGFWVLAGTLVVIAATFAGPGLATVVFCASAVLFTVAEIQQSAAAWGLAQGLAPPTAQAEYFGTFNLHVVTQNVFGPAIVVSIVTWAGVAGWIGIAVVAVVAGILMPWAAAKADQGRDIANEDLTEAAQAKPRSA